MDLNKSYEFFQPEKYDDRLHIIGCGAIGSTVAENLARLGLKDITLYDFDTVEAHNIANQMFRHRDIGQLKVDALRNILIEINPDAAEYIKSLKSGYIAQPLSGYIFLCLDNIDLRREIVKRCMGNEFIKAVFDFRMRLMDAQHYAADWSDKNLVQILLNSMDFTHDEAIAETPVSACNLPLSVAYTVRAICALGVSNFVNFVNHGKIKKFMQINLDANSYMLDAFD